jgi:hypothetical protein
MGEARGSLVSPPIHAREALSARTAPGASVRSSHVEAGEAMPLSEHEENVLKEIERQLAAEDPRFAAKARRGPRNLSRVVRLRLAILSAVFGVLALAMLGILSSPWNLISGGTGMVLLLTAILLGATALTTKDDEQQVSVPPDERT